MTDQLDPYEIFGISIGASTAEIDSAYNSLRSRLEKALRMGSVGAEPQLEQLESAYRALKDHSVRASYEQKSESDYVPFTVQLTPSKRIIETLPEPQVVYLLADLYPQAKDPDQINDGVAESQTRTGGLNLTLVLDQSNSMKGTRLERVKVAATEIINQLTENDYLSVVGFNDRATVLIGATLVDNKKILSSRTRMARAGGGTEILQGLRAGLKENRKNLSKDRVNHIILLTDGKTYGDEEESILLANSAAREGISISTLGLGQEWNDVFLDDLASITGGASGFIKSANSVVDFMNRQVEKLTNVFVERIQASIATFEGAEVEMAFKIKPSPQPIAKLSKIIQLGGLPLDRSMSVLFQIQIPANISVGFHEITRLVFTGDIINDQSKYTSVSEFGLEVAESVEYEEPPEILLDALGKLTLYNMQEQATEAIERGNVAEATERLQNLATRLLEMGHDDLANETLKELGTMQLTKSLSDGGRKNIKYETRHLISPDSLD